MVSTELREAAGTSAGEEEQMTRHRPSENHSVRIRCFLAGAGLILLAQAVVGSSKPQTEAERCVQLVKRWGISEPPLLANTLWVPFADGKRQVWFRRKRAGGPVDEVWIMSMVTESVVLEYSVRGELGRPKIVYHGERPKNEGRRIQEDLNVDGTFDVLYKFGPKAKDVVGMYIPLNGSWTRATAKGGVAKGATTDKGERYRFDLKSGKWVPAPKGKTDKGTRK